MSRILLTTRTALCCTVLAFAGCGSSGAFDQYVPSNDTARDALDVALGAWQEGRVPGSIETDSPAVQAVDLQWQQGRKLVRYVVVEQLTTEGPPRFAVRLVLADPAAEIDARYVVLGREPFWVFREEDFARISGL